MSGEQKKAKLQRAEAAKVLRPILIISRRNIRERSLFLSRLLLGLVDESIPLALVSPRGWVIDPGIPPTVNVINYPDINLPFINRSIAGNLAKKLTDFKPTVIHCLCESKARLAKRLAEQLNLPYILTIDSPVSRMNRLHLSSNHLVAVTAPSKKIAGQAARRYPKYAEKIEQVNIGVFLNEENNRLRELNRVVVMITSAPFRKAEKLKNLLAALRRLAIDGFDFILVIVGGGRAERKLRKSITDLGLSQKVTIVSDLLPARSVLAAGDIFIKITQSHSFDPLLLEAMASGLAVASCEDKVNDLVIDDETAVVFNVNDELSIYEALRNLLARPDESTKLARQAFKYLKENNSVSGMISALLQLYRSGQNQFKN